MNNRARISLVIGGVVFLATLAIFVIAGPAYYPSTGIGFGFLLFGELVLFAGIVGIEYWAEKSSGLMTRAGLGTVIGVYSLIVIVTSFLYMSSQSYQVRAFLILQIILLAITFTIAVLVAHSSRVRIVRDSKILHADAMAKDFENRLVLISEQTGCNKELDSLIDGMKYTDTSVIVDADVEINDSIAVLEKMVEAGSDFDTEMKEAVQRIEFLIKKRNLQTRSAKHGGI